LRFFNEDSETSTGSTYKVKGGVDVYVAVQVNVCDNVKVDVNVFARTFPAFLATSSV
jgi:hypothetical protein